MLLTILTILFSVFYYKAIKKGNHVKYFLPLVIFLTSSYMLAVISFNFILGWIIYLLLLIGSIFVAFLCKIGKISEMSKRVVKLSLVFILAISLYTQFFNGIETFYYNPIKYFQYSKGITYKYYFIPPKIISNRLKEKEYVYSLTQYKNAFFAPESMTQIDMYEGKVCYYSAMWSFGKVPSYYRRYFSNNDSIDSPA